MRYLLLIAVLFTLGCWPNKFDNFRETCEDTPSGAVVYIHQAASEGLDCVSYRAYELEMLAVFDRYYRTLDNKHLREVLKYTRVEVWPKGEQPLEGADGYTICEAAYVATRSADMWHNTSVAHEYVHLAQNCDATQNPVPDNSTKDERYKAHHDNWCVAGAWRLIDEANHWEGASEDYYCL